MNEAAEALANGDLDRAARLLADAAPTAENDHLRGLLALRRGDLAAALEFLGHAARAPIALYQNDYAVALRHAGRIDECAATLARATELDPANGEAWHNLGMVRRAQGDLDGAAAALGHAAALRPESLTALGLVELARGHEEAAILALERVCMFAPEAPTAWFNLALARQRRDPSRAREAVDRALKLDPAFAPALDLRGVLRRRGGDLTGAVGDLERAAALAPDDPRIAANLGAALLDARDPRARAILEHAVARDPGPASPWVSLGGARQEAGDFAAARAAWEEALRRDPAEADALSALLMARQYDPDTSAQTLLDLARRYGDAIEPSARIAHATAGEPARPLRLGYVSPDFRDHACARFTLPLIANHGRDFAVTLYAELSRPDPVTREFQALGMGWRETRGMTDAALARAITADRIDILIDCAGHTAGNRLKAFAHGPAPIQISWLGYPGSPGVRAIGHRLSDAIADPPGVAALEDLIRVPDGFLCFRPQTDRVPAWSRGLTFGSFNNAQKITPAIVGLWREILEAVPGSRLVLKSKHIATARPLLAGIDPARLDLIDYVDDGAAHLALYDRIDVALDTFPYNGTTTTCEALWMGVPVVTLAGDRHAARVGASLLARLGLDDLIARDGASYVHIAAGLMRDAARLEILHQSLRARMAASPLRDETGFARRIETIYRDLWRGIAR